MITNYGAQAARRLCVQSPRSLTPRRVLIHKEEREIHSIFIYEPIQELDVKKNSWHFLVSD